MFPTDAIEISRLLRSMKSKTSTSHDGLSSKLIKQLASSISYPISIITNRSFETGVVPISMKIAKIVPIYKAKDKTDMGNYMHISLLPTVSKILQKAVHHRLYFYCKAENILYADQYAYGFQPQRSTIDAIENSLLMLHYQLKIKTQLWLFFLISPRLLMQLIITYYSTN